MEAQGIEKCAAEAHDGVDASHDLKELNRAADDHHIPVEGSSKDLGPGGLPCCTFRLQLQLHLL